MNQLQRKSQPSAAQPSAAQPNAAQPSATQLYVGADLTVDQGHRGPAPMGEAVSVGWKETATDREVGGIRSISGKRSVSSVQRK